MPILTSRSEWLLLRPNRGATEPGATLHLPALKRQGKPSDDICITAPPPSIIKKANPLMSSEKDITHYLHHTCSNNLPTSSNLTTEQQLLLINSLIDLIHQTFEPYIGDELNDYLYLFERLWPDWKRPIEIGNGKLILETILRFFLCFETQNSP